MCKSLALLYAWPAYLKAGVYLSDGSIFIVKTMHAATRWFKVHHVELSIQIGIELNLATTQPYMQVFKHFFCHVVDGALVFVYFKKSSKFIWSLLIWIKIHLCLSLQLFPGFKFFFFPSCFFFILEKCWLVFFNRLLWYGACLKEFFLCLAMFIDLSFEQVKVWKSCLHQTMLLLSWMSGDLVVL